MINNLNQLYTKYGTDKGDIGNHGLLIRKTGHKYGDFYQQYFEKYLNKNPDILEIGVYEGMSMLAHNEFYKNECNIVGIDVYNGLKFDVSKHKNISLIIGRSESPNIFDSLKDKRFDIIIDDAIHTFDNQFYNILHYSRLLKPGGIYILEDLQCDIDPLYITNNQFGMDNSPLHTLLCRKKSNLITDEEFEWLNQNITSITLSMTPLELDNIYTVVQVSMTAIITFKNNS